MAWVIITTIRFDSKSEKQRHTIGGDMIPSRTIQGKMAALARSNPRSKTSALRSRPSKHTRLVVKNTPHLRSTPSIISGKCLARAQAPKISKTTVSRFWNQGPPPKKASSLHELVKKNDVGGVLEILNNQDLDFDINAKNLAGDTVLHIAADMNNIKLIQELVAAGADPWQNDGYGLPPAYRSAVSGNDGATRLLGIAMRNSKQEEGPWRPTKGILDNIESTFSSKDVSERAIDELVSSLTGTPIENLNDRTELYRYCSHLHSWIGKTLRSSDEGWNVQRMLPQRIRTLVNLLAEHKKLPKYAIGDVPPEQIRKILADEISSQLETLRADRRFFSMSQLKTTEAQNLLIGLEANQVANRINHLRKGEEYTLPLGFPGHALYVNFVKSQVQGQSVVTMRIDNLGAGYLKTHGQDDVGRVHPLVLNIPLDGDEKTRSNFETMMKFLVGHEVGAEEDDWDTFYAGVAEFHDELVKLYGKSMIDEPSATVDTSTKRAQTAGNCVLKNHSAGMISRLGRPLFKWLKKQEVAYVLGRSENIINKVLYQEKEKEKTEGVLLDYLKYLPHHRYDLKKLLSKPRRPDIAAVVSSKILGQLAEKGEAEALGLLLDHGADKSAKDSNGNSLLHCAVAIDNAEILATLLTRGLDINAANDAGQTPLHLATQLRRTDMVQSLVDAGADLEAKDADGKTPHDLASAQIVDDINITKLTDPNRAA